MKLLTTHPIDLPIIKVVYLRMIITADLNQVQIDDYLIRTRYIKKLQFDGPNNILIFYEMDDGKPAIYNLYGPSISSFQGNTTIPSLSSIVFTIQGYVNEYNIPVSKIITKIQQIYQNVYTSSEKQKLARTPNITEGPTPPSNPSVGDIWIQTT